MLGSVMGVSGIKSGEYQGHAYSNRNIHVMYDDKSDPIDGMKVTVIKMKSTAFDSMPVKVGDNVELLYNQYGQLFIDRVKK